MNNFGRQLATTSSRTSWTCVRQRWFEASSSKRMLHTRRALEYPTENGVGSFLSSQGLQTLLEWQDGLLERLNETVKGTSFATKSPLQTIVSTAGNEEHIQAFSYASLAVNNSFFLDNLKPPPSGTSNNEKEMGQALAAAINNEFGSLADLKLRVLATANGMMSSGWVWLVTDRQGGLAVIPTFGAGTMLVRSREIHGWEQNTVVRQIIAGENSAQSLGASMTRGGGAPLLHSGPSVTSPMSGVTSTPPPINPHTPARSLHSSPATMNPRPFAGFHHTMSDPEDERKRMYNLVSNSLYPLFCVSAYEHAWLSSGYGVWGKERYIENFFSAIHWGKVSQTFDKFNSKSRNVD